jgi:hypothetical protein
MQVYRNYWQPSSQEKKTKPIYGKPKASIGDQTPDQNKQQAYLNGMVDSGTIEPTSLMTTHVKGH